MKVLCVGDIHAKTWILPRVEQVLEEEHVDKVVLMGDYLDDWEATPADNELVAKQITKLKERYQKKLVILWGNHDLSNIRKGAFICSGYNPANVVAANILSKLPLQFAFGADSVLFTHAGVTKAWCKSVGLQEPIAYSAEYFAEDLNKLRAECYNRTGSARGGIDDPSPIWADLEELRVDAVENLNQVVGHTPVKQCVKYTPSGAYLGGEIIACDTFSTYPNGLQYGNETILILNTQFLGNFSVYDLRKMERIR